MGSLLLRHYGKKLSKSPTGSCRCAHLCEARGARGVRAGAARSQASPRTRPTSHWANFCVPECRRSKGSEDSQQRSDKAKKCMPCRCPADSSCCSGRAAASRLPRTDMLGHAPPHSWPERTARGMMQTIHVTLLVLSRTSDAPNAVCHRDLGFAYRIAGEHRVHDAPCLEGLSCSSWARALGVHGHLHQPLIQRCRLLL